MPGITSKARAKEIYYSYPGYEKKLKEFGIATWVLAA
jgi:hypothetical protein